MELGLDDSEIVLLNPKEPDVPEGTITWYDGNQWDSRLVPEGITGDLMIHPEGYPIILSRDTLAEYW